MKYKLVAVTMLSSFFLFSCVSSKKFKKSQSDYATLQTQHTALQSDLTKCNDDKAELGRQKTVLENDKASLNNQIADLNKQIDFLKQTNTTVLKQMEDLSVVSSAQAENIRKSLDNIGAKDLYIQDLQASMARKDSLNLALVMNLKGAVGSMDDQDINIKVDKGVVYIDISDKLLFKSGKYEITSQAKTVLGKVAAVLKNQPDMEYMVEGHTDNVPYKKGVLQDNWDLSVLRASSVARSLQNDYHVDPARIIAAGRSEYHPLANNDSDAGRQTNRRTSIIILPQLDQFFKLLETPKK